MWKRDISGRRRFFPPPIPAFPSVNDRVTCSPTPTGFRSTLASNVGSCATRTPPMTIASARRGILISPVLFRPRPERRPGTKLLLHVPLIVLQNFEDPLGIRLRDLLLLLPLLLLLLLLILFLLLLLLVLLLVLLLLVLSTLAPALLLL